MGTFIPHMKKDLKTTIVTIGVSLIALSSYSQTIPNSETIFNIQKKEKQSFEFSLQKGYTLKAVVKQIGIDLSISVYKKGDTARLAYFDSPNGEYGPERIQFESKADGNYTLLVEPLADDTALEGKYSIRQISIKIFQATNDSSFAEGSHILLDHLTSLQIENLTNLGMLWGFLKYYHPAIAGGDFNWDASLFRILPEIISAKTKGGANAALEKWVDEIGKPDRCITCGLSKSDTLIQGMPDYGKLFTKENLGSALIEKLNFIKENRNQGDNYYVGMVDGVGNPNFEHENPYKNMIYPDAGYRLLSLFRYWNMIQYFYPYKYVIGEDWNEVLPEFIPKFVKAENATQYALACLEIIARIHDTHANIWSNNKELTAWFGKYAAPVRARFIEDKLVVTGFYSDSFSIQEKLKIGDVITMIHGEPVQKLVRGKLYLTPASNYETQLRDMPYYRLLRSQNDSLKLELIRGNQKISCVVRCLEIGQVNYYSELNLNPTDSSYKIINGNIGYIFPGRYHDRQLPEIKKLLANTKGIIIDMRTYPSEFMPFSFGAYIKPAPSPFVKFTIGDLNYPGLFRYSQPLSNGETNPFYYKGPIVELVNSFTQSQAEYTTMAFQTAPDITVIGSTTAGADGNVSGIYLPGGIFTLISGIGIFYPDGTKTQRTGIKIDKIVKPTVEGIKAGKDELLEEAVKIIDAKKP
jgi:C-terminal processing protease CtpA/Prc